MCLFIEKIMETEKWQFLRFFIVGGMATLTHLLTALCLTSVLWQDLSVYIVNFLSFMTAFFVSYIGHRYITFCQSGSIIKFFVIALGGFIMNNIVLFFVTHMGLKDFIAIATSTIFVPIVTYTFSKLWAFNKGAKI